MPFEVREDLKDECWGRRQKNHFMHKEQDVQGGELERELEELRRKHTHTQTHLMDTYICEWLSH